MSKSPATLFGISIDLSLSEALRTGVVDGKSGAVVDTRSGAGVSLAAAISSGTVSSAQPKRTLEEAMKAGLIDSRT